MQRHLMKALRNLMKFAVANELIELRPKPRSGGQKNSANWRI